MSRPYYISEPGCPTRQRGHMILRRLLLLWRAASMRQRKISILVSILLRGGIFPQYGAPMYIVDLISVPLPWVIRMQCNRPQILWHMQIPVEQELLYNLELYLIQRCIFPARAGNCAQRNFFGAKRADGTSLISAPCPVHRRFNSNPLPLPHINKEQSKRANSRAALFAVDTHV